MEDKQTRIEYLRKLQGELDGLSDEEFIQIVTAKYGEDTAKLVQSFGFAGFARQMITKKLQGELEELGE